MNKRLGELLVESGAVDDAELESALALQKQYTGKIGELLINQGSCTEEDVLAALSMQLSLPRLKEWGDLPSDPYAFDLYGMERAWWLKQKAVPLGEKDGILWIAVEDVLDGFVVESIKRCADKSALPVLTGGHELRQLFSVFEVNDTSQHNADDSMLMDLASGAPIIQFVNDTIQRAIDVKASDIHFESYRGIFRVRFRVDGVLHEADRPGVAMQLAIISRLKLMASLDISEKRLPQDGRIRMRVGGINLDIRVATSPGIAGENVVLRLLISEGGVAAIKDLLMQEDDQITLAKILSASNGIILVTGPTGSGKSTTLYAFLRSMMGDERKIITVEDPVEYQTPGITQIPVNAEIGLNFATVLRSVLRQDPDVILIGEIRDRETAEIAVQAALTGHLVLSTLHTNDAPSAFVRLMDMGVEPYLLASSIIGVLGQRLVRTVCPECASLDANGQVQAEALGWKKIQNQWPAFTMQENFMKSNGCAVCFGAGYRGRQPIFEMLRVDEPMRHLLSSEPEKIGQLVATLGMRRLLQEGLMTAARGETTISEVLRVAG
ncbi:MAG: ATPase, T2SS/T4P/T4SS family [Mariprofundaceae bacterium]|nr:ATPase, T2SS/T4P/T4SS family [Mariprofundaceae bacterium]